MNKMHQIVVSIETEYYVDDLLQAKQQEPQHQSGEVIMIETIP